MIDLLRQAWRFRDFTRDFVARYRGTQLGILWPIAHPLSLILIYTLIFSELMRPSLPGHESRFAYSIYLTAGIITWGLFSEVLSRSVGVFVQNANLMKKVSIPKITFPIIATLSALLNFGIALVLFLAFLAISGNFPGFALLAMIPVIGIAILFAMALGTFLATANVFYRDIEQSIALVLQFWFWLTPIVYPSATLPEQLRSVLEWNPMWPVVRAMHGIFVENRFPDWATLAYPLLLAMGLVVLARTAFLRLSNELVDEL